MAFIEIFKDGEKRTVSKSAFENFFKDTGWKAGINPASSSNQNVQGELKEDEAIKSMDSEINEQIEYSGESENNSTDEEWDELLSEEELEEDEDVEKPISEMNREELIVYADKHDISLAGLTKVSQFRAAIREAMEK